MHKCLTPSALVLLFLAAAILHADEEKKPEPPKIAMCVPLAVAKGTTTKIIVRGWHLDSATQVRSNIAGVTIKILSQGSAAIPNKQDGKQIGDQQVEIEITIPETVELKTSANTSASTPDAVMLSIVTPDAESQPHTLLIGGEYPAVADQEPNDGFRMAQTIKFPQIIDGQIHSDGNVDVFAVDLARPTNMKVEVQSRQWGSGMDSILTLYNKSGTIIAVNDDNGNSVDAQFNVTVEPDRYFIAVQDAHDHGGAAHPYRLFIGPAETEPVK